MLITAQPTTSSFLRELLKISGPTFMIIDGLDECEGDSQRRILSELALSLLKETRGVDSTLVKVLISSRNEREIRTRLERVPQISLSNETMFTSKDIAICTKEWLSCLTKDGLSCFEYMGADEMERIKQTVLIKADGEYHPRIFSKPDR